VTGYFGAFYDLVVEENGHLKEKGLEDLSAVSKVLVEHLLDEASPVACHIITGVMGLMCLMVADRSLLFKREDAPSCYARFSAGRFRKCPLAY
jgi:hypothetical protein